MGPITERLLAAGRDRAEPVAFISEATTPRQQVVVATLADAAQVASTIPKHLPTLIVVGPIVALHPLLAVRQPEGERHAA
jgi:uroporphyrin-III C-methyltransferase